jgi:uncharacterized cupredoxin-like copper-binding protein
MTVVDDQPTAAVPSARSDPNARNGDGGGGGGDGGGRASGSAVFTAMIALLVVLVGAVVAIGLIGLLTDVGDDSSSTAASTTVDVTLTEFSIDGQLTAPAGDVTLNVTNVGSVEHNLVVRELGTKTPMLAAGGSATLSLGDLPAGTYQLYCEVAGHESSGMSAELVVTAGDEASGAAASEGATSDTADMAGMDHTDMTDAEMAAMMDQLMVDSMLEFPAETEGVGNQLLEFEVMPDGTKQFELTAAITPWEVSPGVIVDAWAYNGMVPGPKIQVDVGDKVRVIVHNETPMGTDIHWHGIMVPNEQDGVSPFTQDPIASGESFTYEFTVDEPAIAMYHAHLHSQVSVPNGMFAAFVVGENPIPYGETVSGVTIPEDLELAVDMPMVLNDAGVIGLTLNGKSFPGTAPLVLETGDWASVTYYNEGLMAHPMHLHMFPQLVYAKDGIPLDEPYFADTINIAPGERYSVLFQATDPGTWVWHCHILTHVESEEGMFGMATAVVVQDPTT